MSYIERVIILHIIHHILLALRMPCKGCHRISIVLALSCGRTKTIQIRYAWTRIFLLSFFSFFENGPKTFVFKTIRIRVDRLGTESTGYSFPETSEHDFRVLESFQQFPKFSEDFGNFTNLAKTCRKR